ncbi:21664_t:CDS:1 [Dentiscutata erythropus]|uniref:21664_t:CDS:1 n=1 Tax=Dentiscutata erythropus TaxID=1348616 RepID=A0A9N8ZM37_9GLOM|nr:21664_t:CDS:1 [Dentiscutata erythropus]
MYQCVEKSPRLNLYSARKARFISHFALNKGRNVDGFDFCQGKGSIMRNFGDIKTNKIHMLPPIIYLPNKDFSPWTYLRNSSLFTNQVDPKVSKDEIVRIHIPIVTVQYTCKAASEFIQDIRSALNTSDPTEIKRKLEMTFNYYGNYIVTKATLGGAITIKDWSKIPDESKSYLMCYIQWGIDYVKGNALNVFEDVVLDKLPRLEASSNIKFIRDLYTWFKNLYDYKFAEIISYDEYIPSYELLPEELQQQLCNVNGFKPVKNPLNILVPNIYTGYDAHDIKEWIALEPLHNLHLCNWVYINELQHGVIFQRSKLKRGQKAAFKFLKEPKITKVNELIVILSQPKTDQEAYMFENGIILNERDGLELDKIPFTEYNSAFNVPLEDFRYSKHQHSNAIYCQVIFHAINISFDQSDIKHLQEFSDALNSELHSKEPFKNLCRLFGKDYGHLLPRTFMFGGVLSKKYISGNNPTNIKERKFIFNENDPNALKEIEDHLKAWNVEFKDVDTSIFLNNRGDAVRRNEIEEWWQTLANNPNNWDIISLEDWMPICHIVFKGEILLQGQNFAIIIFPKPLVNNNYHVVGNVFNKNGDYWDNDPEATVIFDQINESICKARIQNNFGER